VGIAMKNDFVRDEGEPVLVALDPAPRGRSAWWARSGRNARDVLGSATRGALVNYDNVQLAQWVVDFEQKYHPDAWVIDFGMGTGVIDILKRKSWIWRKVHVVKFGDMPPKSDKEFGSMGAYLWGKMRDWLPEGMIPKDDGKAGRGDEPGEPSNQMTNRGWKWSGREDNRKVLESKDDLKSRGVASPDDADCLAMTQAVNPPRVDRARMARGSVQIAEGADSGMFD
jgi:phage terminase large subunit